MGTHLGHRASRPGSASSSSNSKRKQILLPVHLEILGPVRYASTSAHASIPSFSASPAPIPLPSVSRPTITLEEYLSLRSQKQSQRQKRLSEISNKDYYDLFVEAQDTKNDAALNWLLQDLIHPNTTSPKNEKQKKLKGKGKGKQAEDTATPDIKLYEMVQNLLFNLDLARLRSKTVFLMIQWLDSNAAAPSTGFIQTLAEKQFRFLVFQICIRIHTAGQDSDPDVRLVKMIYQRVFDGIKELSTTERGLKEGSPGDMGFAVLYRLLLLSPTESEIRPPTEPLAIELFTRLFERGWIPNESVSASEEGALRMLGVTAVKACLHWDYRTLAHKFLILVISRHTPPLPSSVLTLTTDTIYTSLSSPRRNEFRSTVELVKTLWEAGERVEPSVVRECYRVGHANDFLDDTIHLFRAAKCVKDTSNAAPLPPGRALLWLLEGLQPHSHLARELVSRVASPDGGVYIPVDDRAQVISLAASQGFGKSARVLYTRYGKGKDRKSVLGSAVLLVRMVSLFQRLVDDAQGGEEGGAKVQDLRDFMNTVIEEFIDVHGGTGGMTHESLTSLARAYFIMGRVQEGFEVYRVGMQRKAVPDMYDLNTMLGVLAEYSPRSAAKMMERMAGKGLEPDSVTLGTVVKYGLLHKDIELVEDVIRRWGDVGLSQKTIGMLLRASVERASEAEVGGVLREVMRVVRSIPEVGSVSLGKYLVYSALGAGEMEIGQMIWKDLLEKQGELGDPEMIQIRKRLKNK
ncbi:hypothetical protein E1B28_012250 [Marasmius oreades]|uniref:Pentatricopeptide repeat-containing protein n=1 Tax=Marasmius oreades TaxID=181124 RepID=A0A9P7UNR3_9AGAR|nr:uncharacterized protein E1B28_012250 [Marasmius oreades]KAG7088235.1 hypothetical protein E1B28_012250 [Marasmius oreades]